MPDLAVVQADLTVVQADLALGSLEALLDAPAEVGHADQLRQWHLGG